jgi:hypothetical protein
MSFAGAYKVVTGGIIDVNVVVVRTHSQLLSVGRVLNSFNPLLRVMFLSNDVIQVVLTGSDGQGSIIVTHSNMSILRVPCNSS